MANRLYSSSLPRSKLRDSEAVNQLRSLVGSVLEFQPHLRRNEPDWEEVIAPFSLSPGDRKQLIADLTCLWILPFADVPAVVDLLIFRYAKLPGLRDRFAEKKNRRGLKLCMLFELWIKMALQGNSIFPQNSTHLARQVQLSLETGISEANRFEPFLRLLVANDAATARAGFNLVQAADPDLIIQSEHERREGMAEGVWKARHKFDDYRRRVLASREFREDWKTIKEHFKLESFRDSRAIIRRSKIPERNWQRPTSPDLGVTGERFQVVFDFFCWKWFLYGMRGDEPLVEKLTYTLTPWGTQIFIPGYWSFDPHRDIDWGKVLKLHRARGVQRQGQKLTRNKNERQKLLKKLRKAATEAKSLGLKGQKRFDHLRKQSGLSPMTDEAQIRRMLRQVTNDNA